MRHPQSARNADQKVTAKATSQDDLSRSSQELCFDLGLFELEMCRAQNALRNNETLAQSLLIKNEPLRDSARMDKNY